MELCLRKSLAEKFTANTARPPFSHWWWISSTSDRLFYGYVWTKAGKGHQTCPAKLCPLAIYFMIIINIFIYLFVYFIQGEHSESLHRNNEVERWSIYVNIRFCSKNNGFSPIRSSTHIDFLIYANIYLSEWVSMGSLPLRIRARISCWWEHVV